MLNLAILASALATAQAAPPGAAPREGSVKLGYFGEIVIPDGAFAVMDGGIHGVSGHTVVVGSNGSARWERRVDSLYPSKEKGSGQLLLSADEMKRVARWRDLAWDAAGEEGSSKSTESPPPSAPRWVWAVVVRRGGETRVLQGGSPAPTGGAPEAVREALQWLIRRVDELAI